MCKKEKEKGKEKLEMAAHFLILGPQVEDSHIVGILLPRKNVAFKVGIFISVSQVRKLRPTQ